MGYIGDFIGGDNISINNTSAVDVFNSVRTLELQDRVEIFTESGTFTPTKTGIYAVALSGGGGGGGAGADGDDGRARAKGGGAGNMKFGVFELTADIGYDFEIGAGGAGASAYAEDDTDNDRATGGTGGTTTFLGLEATGGTGGTGNYNSSYTYYGVGYKGTNVELDALTMFEKILCKFTRHSVGGSYINSYNGNSYGGCASLLANGGRAYYASNAYDGTLGSGGGGAVEDDGTTAESGAGGDGYVAVVLLKEL